MGAPRKERKAGEGLAETTFEPAWKVGKGAFSVALPPGQELEFSPGGSAPLLAPIPFQRIHPHLGRGWAGRQSDAVLSQASAVTPLLAPATRDRWGMSPSGLPENVSVRASHARSGSLKTGGRARDCQTLKARPPGGTSFLRSPAPAPVPIVLGAVAGHLTTTPRRLRVEAS